MIIPKPPLFKVLFVGDPYSSEALRSKLCTTVVSVPYDREKDLTKDSKSIDDVVINYISKNKVDGILSLAQPHPERTCKSKWVKKALEDGIPLGFIWYDALVYESLVEEMSQHSLNIVLDDQRYKGSNPQNILTLWTPTFVDIRSPRNDRPIDVIFVGQVDCEQRRDALNYLLEKNINVFAIGNQPWNKVKFYSFCTYLWKSKICLNFSKNRFNGKFSFKGRTLEAMYAGAMVIEDENDNSTLYFTPGTDLIFYESHFDLYKKIVKYLKDDDARQQIAENGQRKCIREYNVENWWNTVIPRLINFKTKKYNFG